MGYGVMVTQQILVLFFQVRILVVQHEAFLIERGAFFMCGGCFRDDVQTAFFPSLGFCKKIFHLSGYIVSLLKQVYCVLKDVPAIFQPKLSPSLWRTGKGLPEKGIFFCAKRFFNLRQAIFRSAPNDFPLSAGWFPVLILTEG